MNVVLCVTVDLLVSIVCVCMADKAKTDQFDAVTDKRVSTCTWVIQRFRGPPPRKHRYATIFNRNIGLLYSAHSAVKKHFKNQQNLATISLLTTVQNDTNHFLAVAQRTPHCGSHDTPLTFSLNIFRCPVLSTFGT